MSTKTLRYSLDAIRDEARHLVQRGVVDRQQPIYSLCRFIPPSQWECVELELEENDFLLRDKVLDLLGREDWKND